MVAFPASTPVTIPVVFTVAIAAFEDVQTPPAVTLASVVVEPTHTPVVPVIDATVGSALIVTVVVSELVQPFELVYVYVIVALPSATPVTTPVIELTVATDASEDVQTPPAVVFVKIVLDPIHALVVPPIAASVGNAFTFTVACAFEVHPFVVTVYVIVAVPADTPLTTPLASTVATAVLDDVQTPPAVALVSAVVEPAHTSVVPLIAATTGIGLTVTVVVTDALHPFVVTVYVIVVLPAATPVTTPVDASTVAVAVLLELQTPPAVALARAVVEPAHTCVVPLIAATVGSGLTVIT